MSGVPYTFGGLIGVIPLADLDANFLTPITLGTSPVSLGNTITTISGLTLTGVTIASAATPIPVAAGGTGITTPGPSGNYLISNGTSWYSGTISSTQPTISSDTTTNASLYPIFANATSGLLSTAYISNGNLSYNPLLGQFSALGFATSSIVETTLVSATAASGTINFNCQLEPILYYTTPASGNWTINFRASALLSLNSFLAIGQTMTVTFLATQGSTAYFNNAVTIDGVSVTPMWQGGIAPSSGNSSGVDSYNYAICKTADSTYSVFASLTQF